MALKTTVGAQPAAGLLRLVYLSVAVPSPAPDDGVARLLRQATEHNARADITGVLCTGAGHFVQVLEGPELQVLELYARIVRDPRHRHPVLLAVDLVESRMFREWSMAHIEAHSGVGDIYQDMLAHRLTTDGKQRVAALIGDFMRQVNSLGATRVR